MTVIPFPGTAPGGPVVLRPEVADLLHGLGYVYLRHGRPKRAAVLLMLAARGETPPRGDVLRTLAAALIACGLGPQALETLDAAAAAEPALARHPMMGLMRARALLLAGRVEEARLAFRESRRAA